MDNQALIRHWFWHHFQPQLSIIFNSGPLANDKNSLYRASMPDFDKLMDDEFKEGRKQLKSAIKNAKRFYQGHGRHGDK